MLNEKKQNGATLITALIMLIVLTLLVVSGIRSNTSNLRIAGNMQIQEEAVATAQQAVEEVLNTNFTFAPASSVVAVDIDNNGSTDYTAAIDVPTCTSSTPINIGELDASNVADQACFPSGSISGGALIIGASGVLAPTTQSWCSKQKWDVRASINDSNTGAKIALHQGVFLRVEAGTLCP